MCSITDIVPWMALVVSVASACFGGAAVWTSREKLRLDLYNRRFEIYRAAVDFSNALAFWNNTEEQRAARLLFLRAVNESQFLFSTESGIHQLLEKINVESFKKFGIEDLKPHKEIMPKEFGEAVIASSDAVNWIVFQSIPELTLKMKPYLNFHKLTEWPDIH